MDNYLDTEKMINGSSGAFVEELFARYTKDPASVDASWADYFSGLAEDARALLDAGVEKPAASWERPDWDHKVKSAEDDYLSALDPGYLDMGPARKKKGSASEDEIRSATLDTIRCLMMIRTYRVRGHLHAKLDPLELEDRPLQTELDPATYGFGEEDMDRPIFIDNVLGLEVATLREVLSILERTYCSNVGVEFMHINEPE
ncbi:2-oxoglutarate dehydrogenase E1 component, partial [hydrothermal vent metagenome]